MNYTITKTQGDYIDRHNGKTRSGKYYKVECEHDGFTLYYPGSYTKKRVLELTKGNFGFDVEIEYINKLTNFNKWGIKNERSRYIHRTRRKNKRANR